jgi:hypothetical protein
MTFNHSLDVVSQELSERIQKQYLPGDITRIDTQYCTEYPCDRNTVEILERNGAGVFSLAECRTNGSGVDITLFSDSQEVLKAIDETQKSSLGKLIRIVTPLYAFLKDEFLNPDFRTQFSL